MYRLSSPNSFTPFFHYSIPWCSGKLCNHSSRTRLHHWRKHSSTHRFDLNQWKHKTTNNNEIFFCIKPLSPYITWTLHRFNFLTPFVYPSSTYPVGMQSSQHLFHAFNWCLSTPFFFSNYRCPVPFCQKYYLFH